MPPPRPNESRPSTSPPTPNHFNASMAAAPGGIRLLGKWAAVRHRIRNSRTTAAAADVTTAAANSQENKPGSNADEMNTNNVNRLLQ